MRQASHKVLILLFLSLSLAGCDPCALLDCATSNYYGQFRVVSKVDGSDLVFGPTARYDKTGIGFYSLNGNDTVHYEYTPLKYGGGNYDSILHVKFYPQVNAPVYMRLSGTDTDTLTLTYDTYDTKCCGTITEIVKFRLNDAVEFPGNKGTQEIRK